MSPTQLLDLSADTPARLTLLWRIDADHVLSIGSDSHTNDGRIRYAYQLSRKGCAIFEGRDFCSGGNATPTVEALAHAARCLLGFLTLRPGDVEEDYFAEYTPQQLSWRDAFAEELSIYAQDRCCGYCGADHDSPTRLHC
ncbi:hypothetical protein OG417_40015 [Actinoallomurus sp. NBC_01490]|uniref:hypothetical protein n=1 Tax=Actinoallomurus sp. NBC_01490 TaxID=2903557 RepID=UPI002E345372|nr:hypothetical protein [Actinoallomurus sp. NBC_01490]